MSYPQNTEPKNKHFQTASKQFPRIFQALHHHQEHQSIADARRRCHHVRSQLHDDQGRPDRPTAGRHAAAREAGTRGQEDRAAKDRRGLQNPVVQAGGQSARGAG